jgi:hypothetical protein
MEDLKGGGDQDYEDLVWKTTGLTPTSWSDIKTVDPITYYSDWDNKQTAEIEHIDKLAITGDVLLDGTDPTLGEALQKLGVIP